MCPLTQFTKAIALAKKKKKVTVYTLLEQTGLTTHVKERKWGSNRESCYV